MERCKRYFDWQKGHLEILLRYSPYLCFCVKYLKFIRKNKKKNIFPYPIILNFHRYAKFEKKGTLFSSRLSVKNSWNNFAVFTPVFWKFPLVSLKISYNCSKYWATFTSCYKYLKVYGYTSRGSNFSVFIHASLSK